MKNNYSYRILDRTMVFSGKLHRMVERSDGFRFYLDEAFVFALEESGLKRYSSIQFREELIRRGTRPDEIETIQTMLQSAGLIQTQNPDKDHG
ncbi:hypothetical protein K8T06_00145 [bacterium]|nr:hypothetical protein [bacterium]